MLLRRYFNVSVFTIALLAGGCRGPNLELGDPPPNRVDSSRADPGDTAAGEEGGSYGLFHLDSDDYTRAGESVPRQSYALLGDQTVRDFQAMLRYGCPKAFELDSVEECALCTDDEVPRNGATGSDIKVNSVTATGGELPSQPPTLGDGLTTPTSSNSARAWGESAEILLATTFDWIPPSSGGGDTGGFLRTHATLVAPRYLVMSANSTMPHATVRRKDDLVLAWTPREGVANADERVRVTLETKPTDRSTGRVLRVSCEFESSSGRGVIRSDILQQMSPGEKFASMTSVVAGEDLAPSISWQVRYELRSPVRTAEGDAFDAITLE